jgi:hypothetical protein
MPTWVETPEERAARLLKEQEMAVLERIAEALERIASNLEERWDAGR